MAVLTEFISTCLSLVKHGSLSLLSRIRVSTTFHFGLNVVLGPFEADRRENALISRPRRRGHEALAPKYDAHVRVGNDHLNHGDDVGNQREHDIEPERDKT